MIGAIKREMRRRAPNLLAAYHSFRQTREMNRHPLRATPLGFQLAGHPGMQDGSFEPEETALIRSILSGSDVFVDVGANIGYYTCLARALGKRAIAVEPLEQNLSFLYRNLEANGWRDVEVLPVALGRKPGTAPLYGGGTGASLVEGWSGTSSIWRRLAAISTLDIILGTRFASERLLIKVDVEGFELEVLSGAEATLGRRSPHPVWLVEVNLTEHHPEGVNPDFKHVFEIFWRQGYRATAVGDGRVVSAEDVDRWMRMRRREFGSINYLFDKPAEALA